MGACRGNCLRISVPLAVLVPGPRRNPPFRIPDESGVSKPARMEHVIQPGSVKFVVHDICRSSTLFAHLLFGVPDDGFFGRAPADTFPRYPSVPDWSSSCNKMDVRIVSRRIAVNHPMGRASCFLQVIREGIGDAYPGGLIEFAGQLHGQCERNAAIPPDRRVVNGGENGANLFGVSAAGGNQVGPVGEVRHSVQVIDVDAGRGADLSCSGL